MGLGAFSEWAKYLVENKFEYATVWGFLHKILRMRLTGDGRNLESALIDFVKMILGNSIDVVNLEKLFAEFGEY